MTCLPSSSAMIPLLSSPAQADDPVTTGGRLAHDAFSGLLDARFRGHDGVIVATHVQEMKGND